MDLCFITSTCKLRIANMYVYLQMKYYVINNSVYKS